MRSSTLSAANNIHHALLKELQLEQNNRTKIDLAQLIADFNVRMHTGRFVSIELEQELIKIGQALGGKVVNTNAEKKNSILHVVTELARVGGHTRLLENIIENSPGYAHDLIVTKQAMEEIPERILARRGKTIREIFCLPNGSVERKAKALAEAASYYALIYMHIHPNDILPLIAHGINNLNKVVFINHADHLFWVGALLTDSCANIRPHANNASISRRGIANNYILPVAINNTCALNKEQARQKLGVSNDTILFLCISGHYKIIPDQTHDFFATVTKILDHNKNFELYIIGISETDDLKILNFKPHNRIKLLGIIENPGVYQRAADIYLEGFPYGSLIALLESINLGACPVLGYSPSRPHLNMETEPAFDGILYSAPNEKEYIRNVLSLAQSAPERIAIADKVKKNINYFNGGEYWTETIEKINTDPGKKFNVHSATFKEYANEPDDVGLNESVINRFKASGKGNLIQLFFESKIKRLKLTTKISIAKNCFPFQLGSFKYLRFIKFLFFLFSRK